MFNVDDLTLGQIKEIQSMCASTKPSSSNHPMLGKRCLIRTYSAGVHIGDVTWVNPSNSMELKLENSLRLWKWEGGGLSLSSVANDKGKRRGFSRPLDPLVMRFLEVTP